MGSATWHAGGVSIVTIGKFDGVHLGHRYLLRQMADYAHARGLDACVVTFDRHPFEVLRPADAPLRLSTIEEKVHLLREAGADAVWVCPFTPHLARLGAAEFVALIRERWPLTELWVGEGFALGRNRAGTIDVLRALAEQQGWAVRVIQPAEVDAEPVSSTRIRALLSAGYAAEAQRLLGRPFSATAKAA
jgi:riboflavin kinase / FMN adenylyltransferase